MAEIATLQDINEFKSAVMAELRSLREEVKTIKEKKRWMKSKEFMDHFDIKSDHTLKKLREARQVEAKKKLSEWYYNAETYLK